MIVFNSQKCCYLYLIRPDTKKGEQERFPNVHSQPNIAF